MKYPSLFEKGFGKQKTDTQPEDTVEISKTIAQEGVNILIFCVDW